MRSYAGTESIDFVVDGESGRFELAKGSRSLNIPSADEYAKPGERLLDTLRTIGNYQIAGSMSADSQEGWVVSQSHLFFRVDFRAESRRHLMQAIKSDVAIQLDVSALPFKNGMYQRLGSDGALVTAATQRDTSIFIIQMDRNGGLTDIRGKNYGQPRTQKVINPNEVKFAENVANMALIMAYEKIHQDPLSYFDLPPRGRQ